MKTLTKRLWDKQNPHPGDRHRLFAAVAGAFDVSTVLYPGSYVDVAASFAFDDVTYVDSDDRARRFFEDASGVDEIIAASGGSDRQWKFIHGDYSQDLGLELGGFDLLASLYAGFVSEHCTKYLRSGGLLLVNPSHGDVAMATLDQAYQLVAVVKSVTGDYRVSDKNLDGYLAPKRDVELTPHLLHERGRGVAYTRSPFAYLFRRA